jgi:tRNA/rRNA methyltransferase
MPDAVGGPVFILVESQLPDNIGAAARAMLNFGPDRMRLVNPRPEWPNDRARALSAGAESVLAAAPVHRSLAESVADLKVVYATSARPRDLVKIVITPAQAAREMRAHLAAGTSCGELFGPERTGLVNDDVALADSVISVPVNPDFSSINIAQAVLLVAYEWFQSGDATPPTVFRHGEYPPADKLHLMSFLDRLEQELLACGFLRTEHMRAAMVRNIHAMFGRMQLTDQEIRTLHGILTELVTRRLGQ